MCISKQSLFDDLHWKSVFIYFFKHIYADTYSELHSTLTASGMGGKPFVEMKLLLHQGC